MRENINNEVSYNPLGKSPTNHVVMKIGASPPHSQSNDTLVIHKSVECCHLLPHGLKYGRNA